MGTGIADHRWLDIPVARQPARDLPTWGVLAERYERCLRRVAFYVRHRVQDGTASAWIAAEVLERNVDLLLAEHGELEELRRLLNTSDRVIAAHAALPPRAREP